METEIHDYRSAKTCHYQTIGARPPEARLHQDCVIQHSQCKAWTQHHSMNYQHCFQMTLTKMSKKKDDVCTKSFGVFDHFQHSLDTNGKWNKVPTIKLFKNNFSLLENSPWAVRRNTSWQTIWYLVICPNITTYTKCKGLGPFPQKAKLPVTVFTICG